MNFWIIGIGVFIRCFFQVVKIPLPEHYGIISLAPQYNTTKALEVVYQRTLNVENFPTNAGCNSDFLLWLLDCIHSVDPNNHGVIFCLLVIAELISGLVLSNDILRKDTVAKPDEEKGGHIEDRLLSKKGTRLFIMFYFIPFTLSAIYFQSLKIIDFGLIFGFYWLLLNSQLLFSALAMGLLLHHNILYADLILVPFLWLSNFRVGMRIKYFTYLIISYCSIQGIFHYMRTAYTPFPCKQNGLFILNDLSPQLSIYWYWNLEIFERYKGLLNSTSVLTFFALSVPLYFLVKHGQKNAEKPQINKFTTLLFTLILLKSYILFPNTDLNDLGIILSLVYIAKKEIRKIEPLYAVAGSYTVVAVFGFFNVWYKKGGNANMLFFQSFVHKIVIAISFMNIIWNIQKWVDERIVKRFVREDIIGDIVKTALENK